MNTCRFCYWDNQMYHCQLLIDENIKSKVFPVMYQKFNELYPDRQIPASFECIWANLKIQKQCPKYEEK